MGRSGKVQSTFRRMGKPQASCGEAAELCADLSISADRMRETAVFR